MVQAYMSRVFLLRNVLESIILRFYKALITRVVEKNHYQYNLCL